MKLSKTKISVIFFTFTVIMLIGFSANASDSYTRSLDGYGREGISCTENQADGSTEFTYLYNEVEYNSVFHDKRAAYDVKFYDYNCESDTMACVTVYNNKTDCEQMLNGTCIKEAAPMSTEECVNASFRPRFENGKSVGLTLRTLADDCIFKTAGFPRYAIILKVNDTEAPNHVQMADIMENNNGDTINFVLRVRGVAKIYKLTNNRLSAYSAQECTDSDDGEIYSTAGSVTLSDGQGFSFVKNDECVNRDTYLTEYVCNYGGMMSRGKRCESDEVCQDGAISVLPQAKEIVINSIGVELTDYPVKMTMPKGSDDNASRLRFFADGNIELKYFNNDDSATDGIEVFVEVPQIPANGSVTIHGFFDNDGYFNGTPNIDSSLCPDLVRFGACSLAKLAVHRSVSNLSLNPKVCIDGVCDVCENKDCSSDGKCGQYSSYTVRCNANEILEVCVSVSMGMGTCNYENFTGADSKPWNYTTTEWEDILGILGI